MDNEQPHQELVKCVLVGDTAVGKTRLICARACNKHISLSQLLATHVPTVWAIDQYRMYKDVLERSWEVVDSVNVSLRLWDTFGDHDKDRRFAYGRSDVVLLCFSIANPLSLQNCLAMWYPEIRRFCPQTPVILVGCKNDLRYMYRDETYLSYIGDRSPFVRAPRKSDLVMPDEARAVAKELGVCYYETSVFTYFGVNEVFENAIRAALIARRQQRFWMTNLKRVQRPLMQAPFRPPKPLLPEVQVMAGTRSKDLLNMLTTQRFSDLVIVVGAVKFAVHKFMLVAASSAFHRLLTMDFSDMGARSSSESSIVSSTYEDQITTMFNDDTESLLRNGAKDPMRTSLRMWDQLKRRSSYQALPTVEPNRKPPPDVYREFHRSVFKSIKIVYSKEPLSVHYASGSITSSRANNAVWQSQTIVTMNTNVLSMNPVAMKWYLHHIYTEDFDENAIQESSDRYLNQSAVKYDLIQLIYLLSNFQTSLTDINEKTTHHFTANIRKNLEKFCITKGMFGDLTFELDDGRVKAHRSILVARCEVMRAMLNGDFREAHANVIVFPGVTEYTFHKLLYYIYTDEIPEIAADKCLNLLELANRLCLPRLLNLVECRVIEDLTKMSQKETSKAVEQCLKLLETVKLHNAHQLAEWCMSYLCINYNIICKVLPKSLKALHPENQDYLREHRWPPVWYLKDYDYYQRCMNEFHRELRDARKRAQEESCFCFHGLFSWLTGKAQKNNQGKGIEGVVTAMAASADCDAGDTEATYCFNSNPNSVDQIDIEERYL